jgi:DNA-binding response OmpR family regulator
MCRVLVVDDCRDTAVSLSLLLGHWGHDVRHALDGDSALAEADRFHPHAVVLDLAMPEMGGDEVARRLRERSRPCRPVLVALTGFTDARHRALAGAAGFDYYLIKPAAPESLRAAIGACADA